MKIGRYLFEKWDVVLLLVSMAVVLGFELAGIFEHHYATITALAKTYVPGWALAMVWGWLGYHFLMER